MSHGAVLHGKENKLRMIKSREGTSKRAMRKSQYLTSKLSDRFEWQGLINSKKSKF